MGESISEEKVIEEKAAISLINTEAVPTSESAEISFKALQPSTG